MRKPAGSSPWRPDRLPLTGCTPTAVRLDRRRSAGPRRSPSAARGVTAGVGRGPDDRLVSSGPGRRGAGAAARWPGCGPPRPRAVGGGTAGRGSARAWGSRLRCAGSGDVGKSRAARIRIQRLPQTRRVDTFTLYVVVRAARALDDAAVAALARSAAAGRRGPLHLAGRRRSRRWCGSRPTVAADDLDAALAARAATLAAETLARSPVDAAVEEVVAMDDEQQLVWRAEALAQSRPRPWRSSIMPSAAPSGPRARLEPGEHLLLAGQRQPGAAAGGAERADLAARWPAGAAPAR